MLISEYLKTKPDFGKPYRPIQIIANGETISDDLFPNLDAAIKTAITLVEQLIKKDPHNQIIDRKCYSAHILLPNHVWIYSVVGQRPDTLKLSEIEPSISKRIQEDFLNDKPCLACKKMDNIMLHGDIFKLI